jgi:hypothetical protein
VNAAVQIHLAGEARNPDAVAVIGRVAAPIEMSPSLLVLPRASTSGPVYHGTCVCRSTAGKPVTVTVDPLPAGLTADLLDQPTAELQTVRITWDPEHGRALANGQRQVVRFRAKAGNDEVLLELPVLLQK